MNKTFVTLRPYLTLAPLTLLALGCGSPSTATQALSGSTTGGGNGSGSAVSSAGAGGSGASAGASGTTSGTGASGAAGMTSGSASSGSAPSGASAGASAGAMSGKDGGGASGVGTGVGDAGDGGTTLPLGEGGLLSAKGIQTDPGSIGDGTTMTPGPYTVPPESTALQNGALAGILTTPALYASPAVYPGIKFQYTIFVPAQYQKGKPAALMIFLDGREWVTTAAGATTIAWTDQGGWHADNVLANMIHSGDIPVTIAVFIDPGTPSGKFTGSGADNSTRSTQYDHPDDKYSQFTLTEFLPDVVLPNYDIVQDPNGWCGVGHSSGGVAVFNMAFLNPDVFHKSLTFSASFPNTGGVYPAKIASSPVEPIRYFLETSPNDLCCGWYAQNMTAAADLVAKGYHSQLYIGTSPHFPSPADVQNFPEALRWMWRGYSLPWYP
jgi:enterochelin esterase-like enzyme